MEESRDEEHHSLCIEARPFHLLYQRIVNVSEKEDNAVVQRETEKWRRKEGRTDRWKREAESIMQREVAEGGRRITMHLDAHR